MSAGGALFECSTTQSTSLGLDLDAGSDGALPGTADATPLDPRSLPPDAAVCAEDGGLCLSGTAAAARFPVAPNELEASLYALYPFGSTAAAAAPAAITTQKVARDGTWAFSGLAAGAHYFVAFYPGYPKGTAAANLDAGGVTTWVGPLSVPGDAGGSVGGVVVKPAELHIFEQALVGGTMQVNAVLARLAETQAGTSFVSIAIGDASAPVPYSATNGYYFLSFSAPPAAQSTYRITTQAASELSPSAWTLVADPPAAAGTITAPAPGVPAPAHSDLNVAWTASPEADYVLVEIFRQVAPGPPAQYAQAFAVAPPSLDTLTATIPGANLTAGTYLIDISFTRANCPASAAGCVRSGRVVTQQLTVQ